MGDPLLTLAGFFGASFLANVINPITGGGGLVSVPLFIYLGLSPAVALGTNKLSNIPGIIVILSRYARAKKIRWEYTLGYSLLSLVGGLLGGYLLSLIGERVAPELVGILILIVLPLSLFSPELGIEQREVSKREKQLGFIFYFLISVFAGFFGPGAGVVIFYILMRFGGFTIITAIGTQVLPWFALTVSSLLVLWPAGLVDISAGLAGGFGAILGGYIGAGFAIKRGERWVKRLFLVMVGLISLRLFWL